MGVGRMDRTPLDMWAKQKCGGSSLRGWQLANLRQTLAAANAGRFYRGGLPAVEALEDLRRVPFTCGQDLAREGAAMACAPQGEIARVVTIPTSGTTAQPKRIGFTAGDIELTVDYFAAGLPTVVRPGGTMAVMMPCTAPDGVGDLICRGLGRIPVNAVPHGPLARFGDAAAMLAESGAQAVVGLPVQMLALTRYLALKGLDTKLEAVLLSGDNIPEVAVRELRGRGLRVYSHYGMTETGYGCAIDCDAHAGMHIREPDMLIEIVDPRTGENLPDGEWGEIVLTTLTRRGMPMIRYRTGDRSRLLPGACPCGSGLRRLDRVEGRAAAGAPLKGGRLTISQLDEALLALPQVMDYRAEVTAGVLRIGIAAFAGLPPLSPGEARRAVQAVPAVGGTPGLEIEVSITADEEYRPLHGGKRTLAYGKG